MDKVKRQDSLSSYASRRDGDSCRMLEDKWRNKENGFIDVLSQQEDVLLMDVRGRSRQDDVKTSDLPQREMVHRRG